MIPVHAYVMGSSRLHVDFFDRVYPDEFGMVVCVDVVDGGFVDAGVVRLWTGPVLL